MLNSEPQEAPLKLLERQLIIESIRVTEKAAIAAAHYRGRLDERAADQAAVDAMRNALNRIELDGTVVIGEGDQDDAPMLFVGESVGTGNGAQVDIAIDPLEGATICAKNLSNALSVMAIAEKGSLLKAPGVYMDKLAIGPEVPADTVNIDNAPGENIEALAAAKGVKAKDLCVCILDRPRHSTLISKVHETGASIRLIGDGDIAGVMQAGDPGDPTVDMYMGIGGAPEGVLAAAALRCNRAHMQARLVLDTSEKRALAKTMGIDDPNRLYVTEELAAGDVMFAATGVTDGALLKGVRIEQDCIRTHSIVMRGATGTVREMRAVHRLS